jgi:hypothetical protein
VTRRGIVGKHVLAVEAEDADIVLTVQNHKLIGAELDGSDGGWSGRVECHIDSFLSVDVDNACAELGFICTDSEERLDGIIGKDRYLRIDTIAGELSAVIDKLSTRRREQTYLIQHEYI